LLCPILKALDVMQYNNPVFMLKNIEVNTGMLENRETDHI